MFTEDDANREGTFMKRLRGIFTKSIELQSITHSDVLNVVRVGYGTGFSSGIGRVFAVSSLGTKEKLKEFLLDMAEQIESPWFEVISPEEVVREKNIILSDVGECATNDLANKIYTSEFSQFFADGASASPMLMATNVVKHVNELGPVIKTQNGLVAKDGTLWDYPDPGYSEKDEDEAQIPTDKKKAKKATSGMVRRLTLPTDDELKMIFRKPEACPKSSSPRGHTLPTPGQAIESGQNKKQKIIGSYKPKFNLGPWKVGKTYVNSSFNTGPTSEPILQQVDIDLTSARTDPSLKNCYIVATQKIESYEETTESSGRAWMRLGELFSEDGDGGKLQKFDDDEKQPLNLIRGLVENEKENEEYLKWLKSLEIEKETGTTKLGCDTPTGFSKEKINASSTLGKRKLEVVIPEKKKVEEPSSQEKMTMMLLERKRKCAETLLNYKSQQEKLMKIKLESQ
jgi:hypothetical protein